MHRHSHALVRRFARAWSTRERALLNAADRLPYPLCNGFLMSVSDRFDMGFHIGSVLWCYEKRVCIGYPCRLGLQDILTADDVSHGDRLRSRT